MDASIETTAETAYEAMRAHVKMGVYKPWSIEGEQTKRLWRAVAAGVRGITPVKLKGKPNARRQRKAAQKG